MARIELGMEVKDTVTGFCGIAVCRANWLHGCERIGIRPRTLDKDNRPCEAEFFDEPGLEVIGRGVMPITEPEPAPKKPPGGPNREQPGLERY